MPRPTKMTPEAKSRIILALQAGSYLKIAAASAGISEATIHRYLAGTQPEHRAFRAAARQATAEGEVRLVGGVLSAARTNPAAAMRLLERRHPGRWGLARANLAGRVPDEIPDEPVPVDERPPTFTERVLRLTPEWQVPIFTLLAAAARGETPESFFEGPDLLASLRDTDQVDLWWKETNGLLFKTDPTGDAVPADEDRDQDPAEDDDGEG